MTPRIVITGATGWIGTALLAHLAQRFGSRWAESVALFGSSARTIEAPDGSKLAIRLLGDLAARDVDDAIVIHLAYLTKEKVVSLGERLFTDTNLAIDDRLLNALERGRPRAVFVASSGAAKLAAEGKDRHPYGLCKLRQEDRLLGWGAATGTPVIAGRIFNLAGPYINKVASYAIGSFALQARQTGKIRIDARVPVFRSFLHVDDLCALIVDAALRGVHRYRAIDLCGAEALEMSDIADAVIRHSGIAQVEVVRDGIDWSKPSLYLGDPTHTKVLAMEVGRKFKTFDQQVVDTLAWLCERLASIRDDAGGGTEGKHGALSNGSPPSDAATWHAAGRAANRL